MQLCVDISIQLKLWQIMQRFSYISRKNYLLKRLQLSLLEDLMEEVSYFILINKSHFVSMSRHLLHQLWYKLFYLPTNEFLFSWDLLICLRICCHSSVLAAWFRLKYPHIALGAVASSAPVLYFDKITPSDAYYSRVTKDFRVKQNKIINILIKIIWFLLLNLNQWCRKPVRVATQP